MRRWLITAFLVGVLVASGLGAWFVMPAKRPEEVTVYFPAGSGARGIAAELAAQNIIAFPRVFLGMALLTGEVRRFRAGEYAIPPNASPRAIAEMLASGKMVIRRFTLVEGWNAREVAAALAAETALQGPIQAIEEGTLLPDTYFFSRGDKRDQLVARMRAAMQQFLGEHMPKLSADVPYRTEREVLTLASIVEKETGLPEERGEVAAVFVNRLRLGMLLQTDPTVIYAVEQARGEALGRPLTTKDLGVDSPYNTYRVPGLPPGPIAMPSKAAILATLNPPVSDKLYFVATGTNGGHRFARTLAEHNENVRQYRAVIRK